jgi:hypothetical protein
MHGTVGFYCGLTMKEWNLGVPLCGFFYSFLPSFLSFFVSATKNFTSDKNGAGMHMGETSFFL